MGVTRDEIRRQLVEIVNNFREDSSDLVTITDQTGIFWELGLETVDAIGLSSALEARFNQSFPFPEFMLVMSQKKAMNHNKSTDITVGELLDFLATHIRERP
jgi:hypothetical protein